MSSSIYLSGPMMQEKAQELVAAFQQRDFKSRISWLIRFHERYSEGEVADVWQTSSVGVKPRILSSCSQEDIFNAEKTMICYSYFHTAIQQ